MSFTPYLLVVTIWKSWYLSLKKFEKADGVILESWAFISSMIVLSSKVVFSKLDKQIGTDGG